MNEIELVNPGGVLVSAIERQLFRARKNKPLWARLVNETREIHSLEGTQTIQPGNYECRGIQGEVWPQSPASLLGTYAASGVIDENGWERFDPKPDAPEVDATSIDRPFQVIAKWGKLTGKAGDYVVRSTRDLADIWIVDRHIFEASYVRC
ncbi:MAG TPA: hypothetical protein PKD54_00375 [Pirellulaceae bacterium]|nr:hypothetical protein [Pirellulaceae bacterium]